MQNRIGVLRRERGLSLAALAKAAGHTPARALYADECHLCYEVRAALRAAGRHPEVVAPGQCYAENEADEGAADEAGSASSAAPATP